MVAKKTETKHIKTNRRKKHNNTTHKWQTQFSLKSKPDSFPAPRTSRRAQYTNTCSNLQALWKECPERGNAYLIGPDSSYILDIFTHGVKTRGEQMCEAIGSPRGSSLRDHGRSKGAAQLEHSIQQQSRKLPTSLLGSDTPPHLT